MSVTCFDGKGQQARAQVLEVRKRELTLDLKEKRSLPGAAWRISLGVAVPRAGKLDQVVREATQLGVHQIVPLATARGVVRLGADAFDRKRVRLAQIAVEAAKQSDLNWLPEVEGILSWERAVRTFPQYDLALLGALEGPHEDVRGLLRPESARTILLLIGPEGDFTPQEIAQAVAAGAHRFSLGPTVLRCETAVVAALSIVSHLLRERPSR